MAHENVGYLPDESSQAVPISVDVQNNGDMVERVKIAIGESGDATDVSTDNPMPIQQRGCVSAQQPYAVLVGDTDSVLILEANSHRANVTIHNHSDDQLYISFWDVCSPDSFTTVMQAHEDYEFNTIRYVGPISALRPSGAVEDMVTVTEIIGA